MMLLHDDDEKEFLMGHKSSLLRSPSTSNQRRRQHHGSYPFAVGSKWLNEAPERASRRQQSPRELANQDT